MLRDEDLLQVMNEAFDHYDEEAVQTLDGRKLAIGRAVERTAYAAAIKACEGQKIERLEAYRDVGDEDDLFDDGVDFGVVRCADAIRSLIQEQPK